MSRITQRVPLILSDEERKHLESLSTSLKAPLREIQWAKILMAYSVQTPILDIAREIGVSRQTVYKCLDKALSMEWEAGLSDFYHRPKEPVITPKAKAWVVSLDARRIQDDWRERFAFAPVLIETFVECVGSRAPAIGPPTGSMSTRPRVPESSTPKNSSPFPSRTSISTLPRRTSAPSCLPHIDQWVGRRLTEGIFSLQP